MIEVLMIGGPADGERHEAPDDSLSLTYTEPPSMFSFRTAVDNATKPSDIETHEYRLCNLYFDCWIGIHQDMTFYDGLKALVRRYPVP